MSIQFGSFPGWGELVIKGRKIVNVVLVLTVVTHADENCLLGNRIRANVIKYVVLCSTRTQRS